MQSDDRSARALAALTLPRETFLSALMDAMAEVRTLLTAQRAPAAERVTHETLRLGEFAAGRVDAARFSALAMAPDIIEPARLAGLEQALAELTVLAAQRDRLFQVQVDEGSDLRDTVRDALAARGRVFGVAHQIEELRNSSAPPAGGSGMVPFRRWSRLERTLAPPLLVEVSGADLFVTGLAEYLDGAQKIVLIVSGAAAPAPLVRLITPGTFVMQTTEPAAVERLAAFDGPGIAAVLPDGAATFVHDPSRGASLARRLEIGTLPVTPQRAAAAGTRRQQADELAWLAELAALAAAAADARTVTADHDGAEVAPADQLAGWLLSFGSDAVT